MNEQLIRVAAEFNPALIHLEKCEQILGNTVKQLGNNTSARIVHVFPDYRPSIPTYVANICPYVDWSLYPHESVKWARQCYDAGAKQLGFWTRGVDPEIFKPALTKEFPKSQKQYDLVMLANRAGNPALDTGQGERGKFLQYLVGAGLQIDLFGTGNQKFARRYENKDIVAHSHVDLEEFSKVVSVSKISLSYNSARIPMYCSWRRIFNTLACGGFLLIRYFSGLERVFKNGVHLRWFDTFEEAVTLARYYLEHSEERNRIATQGRQEVLEYHTWDLRIERMLNLAFKNLDEPKFARF